MKVLMALRKFSISDRVPLVKRLVPVGEVAGAFRAIDVVDRLAAAGPRRPLNVEFTVRLVAEKFTLRFVVNHCRFLRRDLQKWGGALTLLKRSAWVERFTVIGFLAVAAYGAAFRLFQSCSFRQCWQRSFESW